jgi:DNA polymerase III delta subunit
MQSRRGRRRDSKEDAPGYLRTLQDIPKSIKAGEITTVYALWGQETYLLERLLDDTVDALTADAGTMRDFNLDVLDGTAASAAEVITLAETMPMGAPRRVVVVKNPSFLTTTGEPTAMQRLKQSHDAHEAGNHDRALGLLFRALDIAPAALDGPEAAQALTKLRADAVANAPEFVTYLDDAPGAFIEVSLPEGSSGGTDKERFVGWVKDGPPDSVAVVLCVHGPFPRRVIKSLGDGVVLGDVDTLKERKSGGKDPVDAFIAKQMRSAKRTLDADANQELRARTNDDLQALVDEIEKLLAYVGDRERVDVDDVRASVSDGSGYTVFDLTDSIAEGNSPRALMSLHSVLAQGEPPLKIHALLVRQVRMMTQAVLLQEQGALATFKRNMTYRAFMNTVHGKWEDGAPDMLPKAANLNLLKQKPYAMFKALAQASRFTEPKLMAAYQELLAAEEAMKSGVGSDALLLERTVTELLHLARS